ncbi:DUF6596 domain-containing protein [Kitasatospora sp. NPDC086801]|uniref:DUF6596 domain-containing protein n=1 Tax=Kitasatospora sp. NPDC086801 TaxID=3364066 RepID=UPI003815A1E8
MTSCARWKPPSGPGRDPWRHSTPRTGARRPARTGPHGELVPLAEQDRSRWERELLPEEAELITATLPGGAADLYQVEAAIVAVHRQARTRTPGRHRLAADPRPLRPAAARRCQPDGRPQPGGGGRDGPRPGRRTRPAREPGSRPPADPPPPPPHRPCPPARTPRRRPRRCFRHLPGGRRPHRQCPGTPGTSRSGPSGWPGRCEA